MSAPEEAVAFDPRRNGLAELWDRTAWRIVVFIAGCAVFGAVAGLIWSSVTPLASYTIQPNLLASISERGQAQLIAADATFTLTTAIAGVLVGVGGWLMFYRRGWWVVGATLAGAMAVTLMAWRFGLSIGVQDFTERVATAGAGDVVQIDLQLRSMSALLVAPLAAITPIMLLSAFWPERGRGEPAPADTAPPGAE